MSVASTFLQAIGAAVEAAVPSLAGRINYEYYGMVDATMQGLQDPWCNVLWITETVKPLSNQHNALAQCTPDMQIDVYFPADNDYTITTKNVALDMASAIRTALFALYYGRTISNWTGLGTVRTEMSRINLAGAAYFVLSCTPQIELKLAVDEL